MAEKTPLVLLPGLLCDEKLWAPQMQALADMADCQVADLTRHESVTEMAASVLADAPARFALAGLSMGGYVAQEIMRQAPERVLKLALLDTSPRADSDEQMVRRRGLIELAQKGRFKGVTPRLLPLLIHPDRQQDEKLTSVIFAMAEHVGMDGFIRQQKAIMGRPDGRADLAKIAVPTLVLCGRQDALTPLEIHKEIAAGIAGSRLVIVEESGHLPTLERPAEVNQAMREWLRG